MYIFLDFYDLYGNYVGSSGWGGSQSGYVYGGIPTPKGQWVLCGANFGAGTDRPVPANVVKAYIGIWFQYSAFGSSMAEQAAQDIRLVNVSDTTTIADGAITTQKITAQAITADKLAVNSVSTAALQAGAVTAGQIAVGAVTAGALAAGAVTTPALSAGAVTAQTIAAGAITADKMAANSVSTAALQAGAVTAGQIAVGAVTAGALAAGAVTTPALSAGAVTAQTIAAGAITADKMAANSVSTAALQAGAVTAGQIAVGAVTAGALAAGAVTTPALSAGAVTAQTIAAGAITADKMAANSVSTAALQAGAVTAGQIAVGAVTAGALAAGAVTTPALSAGAVTAQTIAAGAITADKMAANSVSTAALQAGAVTAAQIAAGAVTASKLAIQSVGAALNFDPNFTDAGNFGINSYGAGLPNFGYVTNAFGAVASTCVYPENNAGNGDAAFWAYEKTVIPLDPNRVYRLSASLFADGGNGRVAFLAVLMYDSAGNSVGTNWGGAWSGYPWYGVPAAGQFTQYSGVFGAGTARPIPANVTKCLIGLILNYGAGGLGTRMAAQGLRLEEVLPGTLIQDGAITTQKSWRDQLPVIVLQQTRSLRQTSQ
jgi:hypothetical protein